jgi:hypothetical protein
MSPHTVWARSFDALPQQFKHLPNYDKLAQEVAELINNNTPEAQWSDAQRNLPTKESFMATRANARLDKGKGKTKSKT